MYLLEGKGESEKGGQTQAKRIGARCLQEGAKPASKRRVKAGSRGKGSKERGRKEGLRGRASAISAAGSVGGAGRERGGSRVSQSGSQLEVEKAGGGGGGGLKMATNSCGKRQQPLTFRDGPCGEARP